MTKTKKKSIFVLIFRYDNENEGVAPSFIFFNKNLTYYFDHEDKLANSLGEDWENGEGLFEDDWIGLREYQLIV